MIAEISGLPASDWPVFAVTVTRLVSSEPELVMNCLAPLTIHSPPTSSAFVFVAPASLPAPGSVRPKPASAAPDTRSGSHCCFCSSVPKVRIGLMPSPTAASRVIPIDWSTRPISSIARHRRGEAALSAQAGAAVLLGGGEAEQAELAHLRDDVDREVVVAVPLGGVGGDLLLGEVADRPSELLVLGRQLEAHGGHFSRSG